MITKRLVGPLLVFGFAAVLPHAAAAAGSPAPKCAAAKQKAVAKKESGKLGCDSKNAAKADATALASCLSGVEAKFGPAFTKADSKGACVGDPAIVEAQVDSCRQHVLEGIPTSAGLEKCAAAKLKAAAKSASAQVGCYAKATGGGSAVDPACVTKASTGMTAAFTKADAKGACPGDAAAVGAAIGSSCVTSIVNGLPGKPPGCGNGVIEGNLGETCDDGNTANGDGCPASCHVDSCTPTGSTFGAHVTYAGPPGTTISGLGLFVDYPEGKVGQPAATSAFGVSGSVNDHGYGFNDELIKLGGLPSPVVSINFKTCQGAGAAVAGDFSCTVTDASNDVGDVVDPATVTCTVTIP